jgi:cobalamin biosynthesis Mg chelatase CobN
VRHRNSIDQTAAFDLAMNTKLLHFLVVLCCAALIGLGPIRAQNPTGTSDANGSAVTAPARQSDAGHSAVSPSSAASNDARTTDSRKAANNAEENDRGTVPQNKSKAASFNVGWIGLVGLLGLIGLVRRGRAKDVPRVEREIDRTDYHRAA